jgi:hypothetical protein
MTARQHKRPRFARRPTVRVATACLSLVVGISAALGGLAGAHPAEPGTVARNSPTGRCAQRTSAARVRRLQPRTGASRVPCRRQRHNSFSGGAGLTPSIGGARPRPSEHTANPATPRRTGSAPSAVAGARASTTVGAIPSSFGASAWTLEHPGAALSVFISSFRAPPFLLPIYQAAGVAYGVPWQVLAAINEVETDYGLNLSTSSAGAIGWMQFLPSTWRRFGVDLRGSGAGDPYNPADAIFATARYLEAAGARSDLPGAIYAYNHSNWYVQSVQLRARLLSLQPARFTDALTGLMLARFPIAGPLGRYALAPATPARLAAPLTVALAAPSRAPVIAVADGRIEAVGHNHDGWFLTLEDGFGNHYRYSRLGSVAHVYPVLRPPPLSTARPGPEFDLQARGSRPGAPASAGSQNLPPGNPSSPLPGGPGRSSAGRGQADAGDLYAALRAAVAEVLLAIPVLRPAVQPVRGTTQPTEARSMAKERLFAYPYRPASWTAGGALQVPSPSELADYFSEPLSLRPGEFSLRPLTAGSRVIQGTILGHVGKARSHEIDLQVSPGGPGGQPVDPRPVIAGWKLLGASIDAGRLAQPLPSSEVLPQVLLGRALLSDTATLELSVLRDRQIKIYRCGRRDIEAGLVDRRVLAALLYLAASGFDPGVSGLVCGRGTNGAGGESMVITTVRGAPVKSQEGPGQAGDGLVRTLSSLRGIYRPAWIITGPGAARESGAIASPDYAARILVSFAQNAPIRGVQGSGGLTAAQWRIVIGRLDQLAQPPVRAVGAVQTGTP